MKKCLFCKLNVVILCLVFSFDVFSQGNLKSDLKVISVSKQQIRVRLTLTNLDTTPIIVLKPTVPHSTYHMLKIFLKRPKHKHSYFLEHGFANIDTVFLNLESSVVLAYNESFSSILTLELKKFTNQDLSKHKDVSLEISINYSDLNFSTKSKVKVFRGKIEPDEVVIHFQ